MKPFMKMTFFKNVLLAFFFIALAPATISATTEHLSQEPIKVEVIHEKGSYSLLRSGLPYQVKGAGIEYGDMEAFARHGGNSFRTWAIDYGDTTGQQILDKALELGLTVSLNLPINPERAGYDYDDDVFIASQFQMAKKYVQQYKNHPALLSWIIGNELNFNYTNPRVYDAVNDLSKMIHELDPNHPTTTTVAGYSKDVLDVIQARAPDLDFVSIQMYGDLINLPGYIERDNMSLPLFITEWGAVGHWEMGETFWGAPIEQTSSKKADNYMRSYKHVIQKLPHQIIGSYVFLWGQKQERTGTWYGMFTPNGSETETIDVMHYIWNDQWPENRTPKLESMVLDSKTAESNIALKPGYTYEASVEVKDFEKDPLTYVWELRHESTSSEEGGDEEEIPELLEGHIKNGDTKQIILTMPAEPGAYRLFVYAYDDKGHAAHANIPFYLSE